MTPAENVLWCAVREADSRFEADGSGGTKEWIRNYFLPSLREHGLVVCALCGRGLDLCECETGGAPPEEFIARLNSELEKLGTLCRVVKERDELKRRVRDLESAPPHLTYTPEQLHSLLTTLRISIVPLLRSSILRGNTRQNESIEANLHALAGALAPFESIR